MKVGKFLPLWIDKFHAHILTYATLNDAMTLEIEIERGKCIGGISATFLLNFDGKFRVSLTFLGFCGGYSLAILFVLLFTLAGEPCHFTGICSFLSVRFRFRLCFHGGNSVVFLCVQFRKFVSVFAFDALTLKPRLFCGFLCCNAFLTFFELYRLFCPLPPFCLCLPPCSGCSRLVLSECPYLLLLACRKFRKGIDSSLHAKYVFV